MSSIRNITERKVAEDQINRLNRVSAVLSGINSLSFAPPTVTRCFAGLPDRRGARQVQGRVDRLVDRVTMKIVPIASAGAEADFLKRLQDRFSMSEDSPAGSAKTLRVVIDKHSLVRNEMSGDTTVFLERSTSSWASGPWRSCRSSPRATRSGSSRSTRERSGSSTRPE
jgi:hypothetical protein